jgi:hypothetical protein
VLQRWLSLLRAESLELMESRTNRDRQCRHSRTASSVASTGAVSRDSARMIPLYGVRVARTCPRTPRNRDCHARRVAHHPIASSILRGASVRQDPQSLQHIAGARTDHSLAVLEQTTLPTTRTGAIRILAVGRSIRQRFPNAIRLAGRGRLNHYTRQSKNRCRESVDGIATARELQRCS